MSDSVASTMRWTGLALYTLSFFLYAAVGSDPPAAPLRGWHCAVLTFILPLNYILGSLFTGAGPFFQQPLELVAALVTGWINPLFLVTLYLARGHRDVVASLRIALFLMILCCLVVFYAFDRYPREGFFVWVVGMGLVVSSPESRALSG